MVLFNYFSTSVGHVGCFRHFPTYMPVLLGIHYLVDVDSVSGSMLDAEDAKMSRVLRE